MADEFCEQCGATRAEADRFCPSCGAERASKPEPGASAAPAAASGGRRGWPWRRTLLIAVPLLGLLVAGAVAAWVILDDAPQDDAVALVPAQADYYVTAHLSPSLGQKRSVKEVLDRARDAGASDASTESLEDLVADLIEDEMPLDYRRDVAPQLGDQVALFGMDPPGGGPDEGAVLVATDDEQASLEVMRRAMVAEYGPDSFEGGLGWRIVQRSRAGQPYEVAVAPHGKDVGEGEFGFTIVDGFVVMGSEFGVMASLDARAGRSLDGVAEFAAVRDRLPDDVLAFAYVGDRAVAEAWDENSTPWIHGLSKEATTRDEAVGATLAAGDGQLVLEVAAGGDEPFVSGSELLRGLPADAIAAVSFGDVGAQLRSAIEEGSPGVDEFQEALEDDSQFDVERDFASWVGGGGFYIAGSSSDDVEGAVVFETRSAADSDRFVDELEGVVADNTSGIDFDGYGTSVDSSSDGLGFDLVEDGTTLAVRGDEDRVVAGTGAAGFDPGTALAADGGFGDAPAYQRAAAALGGGFDPFLVLDAQPLERLIADLASDNGDGGYFDDVQPWLASVETVAGGARKGDGGVGLRFVVGLRDAGDSGGPEALSGE